MSGNNIRAGRIIGNPLCGLCEKVCVEVKTVIDGCKTVYENEPTQLVLTNFSSSEAPVAFERLYANGSAQLSGLSVVPAQNGRSRVRYTAIIPATVYLSTDSQNIITAQTELSFYQDILLSVPQDLQAQYSVEVAVVSTSSVGRLLSQNLINVRLCAVLYSRITQPRTLVIPTYGDCIYPTCRTNNANCDGVDEIPVFLDS